METGAVEHAIVIEDGDVLELDKNDARKKDKVTTGRILIDSGSSTDVVEDLVIATAAFSPKTASCWRFWPSTSAPARWSSSPR
jgi:mRNA degradation ribonuclease J1/J2